jgi:hypothetical protein
MLRPGYPSEVNVNATLPCHGASLLDARRRLRSEVYEATNQRT